MEHNDTTNETASETTTETTPKRLAANRANAAKSTGPRTPEGKRNSSANALRHGILAKALLVEGESRDRFLALIGDLTRDFQPATAYENALIENMAAARWRQQRIWDIQTSRITREQRRQAGSLSAEMAVGITPPELVGLAVESIAEKSPHSDVLGRYEVRYDRQFHRAGDRLRSIRAERKAEKKAEKNAEKSAVTKRSHQPIENKEEA